MKLDRSFVSRVLPDAVIFGEPEFTIITATHDSRCVQQGSAFFAIKGKSFDGHAFVSDAISRGARVVFVDRDKQSTLGELSAEVCSFVFVSSAEEALYALAAAWRAQYTIPVVGVTGTVGKTTTKELLAHFFRTAGHQCHTSPGNMNTRIGLSFALLRMTHEHTIAVFEMGISHPGEMRELADLVRPTLGIITTLGHQHMDDLPSIGDIAREKKQIFSYFGPQDLGFIHGDLPLLHGASYNHPVVRFGYKTSNQVQARRISFKDGKLHAILRVFEQSQAITLAIPHRGYLTSILAAAAVCYMLDIPLASVCSAIEKFQLIEGRFLAKKSVSGSCLIINDAYNANPESMREALFALDKMPGYSHKIAILGDMLGLGDQSVFWHRQVGRMLRHTKSISQVIFVGGQIFQAAKTMPHVISYKQVPSWKDVAAVLPDEMHGAAVLLKASCGVGLSNLAPILGQF